MKQRQAMKIFKSLIRVDFLKLTHRFGSIIKAYKVFGLQPPTSAEKMLELAKELLK